MNPALARTPFARSRRTPTARISARGARGMLQWIKRAHPAVYAKLERSRPELIDEAKALGGLAATPAAAAAAPSLAERAANVAQAVSSAVLPFLQLDSQRRLLRAQTERAIRGEPPLDVTNLQLPSTRVDIEAGPDTRKALLIGGGAIALMIAIAFFGRRRRS